MILSRIRNGGGLDIETINQVQAWGGLRPIKLQDDESIEITREAFDVLDSGDLIGATMRLLSIKGMGIASASKVIGLFDQDSYVIYDSRVGTALRSLVSHNQRLIKCSNKQWAKDYTKLIWILEIIRAWLNEQGYPFNMADVEMALFMMGK